MRAGALIIENRVGLAERHRDTGVFEPLHQRAAHALEGEGREGAAAGGVEAVGGLHQPQAPGADQLVAVDVGRQGDPQALDHVGHDPAVLADELLHVLSAGLLVACVAVLARAHRDSPSRWRR